MNIYTYVHKSGNARISLQNLAIVLILLSGIFITGTVKGQQGVAPVTTPSGGFAVDGNLLARVPVNTIFTSSNGDFLPNDGAPGTGGNVFTLAGLPLDTTMAFHLVDG